MSDTDLASSSPVAPSSHGEGEATQRDKWLAWRKDGVTATDVAKAATGHYGGMYSAVAIKQGLLQVEQTEQMQRGLDWESRIAQLAELATGYQIVGEQVWIEHPERPEFRYTADGFAGPAGVGEITLDDVDACFESKTVGSNVKWPIEYWRTQCQWQMFCSGLPRNLLAIAVVNDATGELESFRIEWVEADPDRQQWLVMLAEEVLDHLANGTRPEPDVAGALEAVKAVTWKADDDLDVVDLTSIADKVERYANIAAAIKEVEDEKDTLGAQIRAAMGQATKAEAGDYTVSFSKPSLIVPKEEYGQILDEHPEFGKVVLDTDRLKEEAPEIWELHQVAMGARRLTPKKKKERNQ